MSTPELRTPQAGSELPLSPDELAALAGQIYAELTPLQVAAPAGVEQPAAPGRVTPALPTPAAVDLPSPPQAAPAWPVAPSPGLSAPGGLVPVAPRGSVPPAGAATSLAPLATEAVDAPVPVAPAPAPWLDPVAVTASLPGPDTPPYTVPVAPRGSAPSVGAAAGVPETAPLVVPSLPAGPGDASPAIPGLASLLGPWLSVSEPTPRDDLFDLGDARRSGGLPAGTLGSREVVDVGSIRKDFPILSEQVHGRPLIWFDNAATTQKPQAVIDRLAYFYAHENSNIHRAAHELAARATDAYEDARETVRDFLGAGRSEEIVFVRGATEGINLVAQSWGRANLRAGDEILITNLEHHANIVPWQIVAQQTGAVLKVAPVDDRGNLLLDAFTALLDPRTKLVAATQVANATGTVNPVQTLTALAHRAGARVLIDGAQSVPHLGVDLQSLDADFFVFSGHKVFGPTGIGAVFISERVWEETPAWQGGGNMIADVTIERSIYQGPPNKYEAGTGNIADAVGLAAALRYVNEVGIERIAAYEHSLLEYATPKLAAIPGVRLIGTATEKASVLSFVLAGHEPEAVGTALNERGIAVRAGHHCAQPILRRLGVEKTVRPSFAFYNTAEEIDVFLDAVHDLSEQTAATP